MLINEMTSMIPPQTIIKRLERGQTVKQSGMNILKNSILNNIRLELEPILDEIGLKIVRVIEFKVKKDLKFYMYIYFDNYIEDEYANIILDELENNLGYSGHSVKTDERVLVIKGEI